MRLLRDGWKFISGGKVQKNKSGAKIWIVFDPPIEYRKAFQITHKKITSTFELSMQIKGIHEKDGSKYIIEYQIYNLQSKQISSLQRLDWADWDTNGIDDTIITRPNT